MQSLSLWLVIIFLCDWQGAHWGLERFLRPLKAALLLFKGFPCCLFCTESSTATHFKAVRFCFCAPMVHREAWGKHNVELLSVSTLPPRFRRESHADCSGFTCVGLLARSFVSALKSPSAAPLLSCLSSLLFTLQRSESTRSVGISLQVDPWRLGGGCFNSAGERYRNASEETFLIRRVYDYISHEEVMRWLKNRKLMFALHQLLLLSRPAGVWQHRAPPLKWSFLRNAVR